MMMKKLTASAIAAGLVLTIAGPAFAAPNENAGTRNAAAGERPDPNSAAVQRMKDLGIVKGDERGNLNLESTITRAELVTTIVRSFGREQSAIAKHGKTSFKDVKGADWASGWIAEAKALAAERGVKLGTTATEFNPGGKVSQIEALVFIMKFMGVVPANTAGATWYEAWLNEAVSRGLITEAQAAEIQGTAGQVATRGKAFEVLDAGYGAKGADGRSLYTHFVDPAKPELTLTLPATTTEARINVAGTATDNKGIESLTVNSMPVKLYDGAFAQDVDLAVGPNEITVVVTDIAGNVTTATFVVERLESPVVGAPADEGPVTEAPAEEVVAPADETPVTEAPAEEVAAPVNEAPVTEAPAEEVVAPADEAPVTDGAATVSTMA